MYCEVSFSRTKSPSPPFQYIALQIMNNLITTRWKTLPVDQRSSIRNFIVQVVIKIASTEDDDPNAPSGINPAAAAYLHTNSPREKTAFMNKINLIVVQILKQEWPSGTWPNAIDEIVTSSKNNVGLCENNMIILRLLSEEVFDYSAETMSMSLPFATNVHYARAAKYVPSCFLQLPIKSKPSRISSVPSSTRFSHYAAKYSTKQAGSH